jgi:hypothetical protein
MIVFKAKHEKRTILRVVDLRDAQWAGHRKAILIKSVASEIGFCDRVDGIAGRAIGLVRDAVCL